MFSVSATFKFGTESSQIFNPSVLDAQNWRISVFEKRLHETETSHNVVDGVKRSSVGFIS